MTFLLTHDELVALTDRRSRAGQVAWLRDRGWRFEVGGAGWPKVARAEYERRMIGGRRAPAADRARLELVR